MSNEIQFDDLTSNTEYALIRNVSGLIWRTDTLVFENYNSANYSHYTISATEQGATGYYTANFPTQITAGTYNVEGKRQLGGSSAQSDTTVGTGTIYWNGSAVTPNSNRFFKNVVYNNFGFLMTDNSGNPKTGLAITAQRSIDGGAFVACANTPTELSNGWYLINLASSDTNGDSIVLRFSATGVPDQGAFLATQTI